MPSGPPRVLCFRPPELPLSCAGAPSLPLFINRVFMVFGRWLRGGAAGARAGTGAPDTEYSASPPPLMAVELMSVVSRRVC